MMVLGRVQMLLNCDRECRAGRAVAAPPRRRRPRGRGWAGLITCPMPDQMRMSMPDGNRCSGWAVTAVDALARDVLMIDWIIQMDGR